MCSPGLWAYKVCEWTFEKAKRGKYSVHVLNIPKKRVEIESYSYTQTETGGRELREGGRQGERESDECVCASHVVLIRVDRLLNRLSSFSRNAAYAYLQGWTIRPSYIKSQFYYIVDNAMDRYSVSLNFAISVIWMNSL